MTTDLVQQTFTIVSNFAAGYYLNPPGSDAILKSKLEDPRLIHPRKSQSATKRWRRYHAEQRQGVR